MDLIQALKSIFTNSTGTGTRMPLLNNSGEAVGCAPIENVVDAMGLGFRIRGSSSTSPVLFKIWEGSGNVIGVLKIIGKRRTYNHFFGMVELQVGRYTTSGPYDKTKVLSVYCVTDGLHLYKKIEGNTVSYYAQVTAISYPEIVVTQLIGTLGKGSNKKLEISVSNLDIASLTEIPLVV